MDCPRNPFEVLKCILFSSLGLLNVVVCRAFTREKPILTSGSMRQSLILRGELGLYGSLGTTREKTDYFKNIFLSWSLNFRKIVISSLKINYCRIDPEIDRGSTFL